MTFPESSIFVAAYAAPGFPCVRSAIAAYSPVANTLMELPKEVIA
jgi:hypothetical protein